MRKSAELLIVISLAMFAMACGPTEVSVDVKEVNVDASLGSAIQMPESPQISGSEGSVQLPVVIPTPAGLEAINETIGSISTLSQEFQKTAESFGEIFSSIGTPPAPNPSGKSSSLRLLGLNDLLLAGFIVTGDTTTTWTYTGLQRSYAGFIGTSDRTLEVFIFNELVTDPSLISTLAVDQRLKQERAADFYRNFAMGCGQPSTCAELIKLLADSTIQ